MTVATQDNHQQNVDHDKEINFKKQAAYYESQLQKVNEEKARLAKELEERKRIATTEDDDDDYSEPYIDKKKFRKELSKFGQETQQKTQSEVQNAIQAAIKQDREDRWIEEHKDFISVMQNADKLAARNPQLARNILNMPDSFERQQLVYNTIKELGLDQAEKKEPSIQEKIDANRRSPFYQPSGTGTAPYSTQSDFSPSGQKNAYENMMALKARLRLS